jgi:hypothetical protein
MEREKAISKVDFIDKDLTRRKETPMPYQLLINMGQKTPL